MIVGGVAYQFVRDQITGTHNLEVDTVKFALFNTLASVDRTTVTVYNTIGNECSGSGYTAGGNTLTLSTVYTAGALPGIDIADTSWVTVDLGGSVPAQAIRAGVIYNVSKSNKVIAVVDFGGSIPVSAATLSIVFPDATNPANAFIRGLA